MALYNRLLNALLCYQSPNSDKCFSNSLGIKCNFQFYRSSANLASQKKLGRWRWCHCLSWCRVDCSLWTFCSVLGFSCVSFIPQGLSSTTGFFRKLGFWIRCSSGCFMRIPRVDGAGEGMYLLGKLLPKVISHFCKGFGTTLGSNKYNPWPHYRR